MLDRAARRQAPDGRILWRQADALTLPFVDESFDAVVCQFGAMFFSDRVRAYNEARRVMKPNGRFLFNVWDRIEANDFACVVTDALGAMFPADPPRFLARIPHGYHDVDETAADLQAAGFSTFEIETLEKPSDALTARLPAVAYCQGSPLRNEIEARDPTAVEAATARAAEALAKAFGGGPISGRMRRHVARRPPKPPFPSFRNCSQASLEKLRPKTQQTAPSGPHTVSA